MSSTLRRLLRQPELRLRLLVTPSDDALDLAIDWAANSDLGDPTPFLSAGQALLTTGTQFTRDGNDTDTAFRDYVDRLHAHGISCIGYGTEIVRDGTPDALIAACERAGMPLFEVPYQTPFIAIIRFVADRTAEAAHARDNWALRAHRSISFAALRSDGLNASAAELSRQLNRWVALYDARGAHARSFGDAQDAQHPDVLAEVTRLIAREQRSSSTLAINGHTVDLQTIGRRGELRGVLATGGGGPLDQAAQTVVTSVIALAGLALEQSREIARSGGRLRAGLFQALLGGNVPLVHDIARQMGESLPTEPIRVMVARADAGRREHLFDDLDDRSARAPGSIFFAEHDGDTVVCTNEGAAAELARGLASRHQTPIGVSDSGTYNGLDVVLRQAVRAREHAGDTGTTVGEFAEIAERGVSALLAEPAMREIAASVLHPVSEYDALNGTELITAVRVWIEHNGQWDPAASELGIHRHTLRNRVALVERITGRSLSSFPARANLWLALAAEQTDDQAAGRLSVASVHDLDASA